MRYYTSGHTNGRLVSFYVNFWPTSPLMTHAVSMASVFEPSSCAPLDELVVVSDDLQVFTQRNRDGPNVKDVVTSAVLID